DRRAGGLVHEPPAPPSLPQPVGAPADDRPLHDDDGGGDARARRPRRPRGPRAPTGVPFRPRLLAEARLPRGLARVPPCRTRGALRPHEVREALHPPARRRDAQAARVRRIRLVPVFVLVLALALAACSRSVPAGEGGGAALLRDLLRAPAIEIVAEKGPVGDA